MGLFVGAGVIISRYFGAKCYDRLEAAVHTDLAFAMVCGVLLTLVGIFLTPQILVWMRTPEDVLPQSIQYFRLYFMGSLFMIVYNAWYGHFAGGGRQPQSPALPHHLLHHQCDVGSDLRGSAEMGCQRRRHRHGGEPDGQRRAVLPEADAGGRPLSAGSQAHPLRAADAQAIMAQGIPSGVQNSIIAIANVVVQSNINTFGSDAMAGCGSYAKVEGFVFLPITSFAMALTTFTGQNLGAGQYERAKRGAPGGLHLLHAAGGAYRTDTTAGGPLCHRPVQR